MKTLPFMQLVSRPGDRTDDGVAVCKEPVEFVNLELPPTQVLSYQGLDIAAHQTVETGVAIDRDLLGTLEHLIINGYGHICHSHVLLWYAHTSIAHTSRGYQADRTITRRYSTGWRSNFTPIHPAGSAISAAICPRATFSVSSATRYCFPSNGNRAPGPIASTPAIACP